MCADNLLFPAPRETLVKLVYNMNGMTWDDCANTLP
jgi:hypothetical protein